MLFCPRVGKGYREWGVEVISMHSGRLPFQSPEVNFQFVRSYLSSWGAEIEECFYVAERMKTPRAG